MLPRRPKTFHSHRGSVSDAKLGKQQQSRDTHHEA
jgi:hypothetical protein